MSDPVPDVSETRVNKFCVNHKTGSSANPCCLFSFNVNVTNCDGFLVYYFQKDDILCPSGYCKGNMTTCPVGSISSTGFEPCPWRVPRMFNPPLLDAPVISSDGKDFTQSCDVMYNDTDPDAAFKVTWLFDNKVYKTVDLTNETYTATLTSRDWSGHFGEKLSCSVEAYFSTTGYSKHSKAMKSNSYFGGLELSPVSLTLDEGQSANVTIRSTLPIICANTPLEYCKLDVKTIVYGQNRNDILIKDGCSLALWGKNWDGTKNSVEAQSVLSTVIDPVIKSRANVKVQYSVESNQSVHYIGISTLMQLDVATVDHPDHLCYMIGSAQILGFEQRSYYDIGDFTGDFLMYNGSSSSGRALQVQTRVWKPFKPISSICGVALQYSDVLIRVDMCTAHPDLSVPTITQGESNPDDVRVYLCNSDFEIVTADGVRLTVAVRHSHLDVKLHIPPQYNTDGEGACSFKNHYHWFKQSDNQRYGLSVNQSFFERGSLPFMKVTSSRLSYPNNNCDCGNTSTVCGLFQTMADPGSPLIMDSSGNMKPRDICKLIVPHALNPDATPVDLVPNHHIQHQRLDNPHDYCQKEIRRFSSHACLQNFGGHVLEGLTDMCIEDARMGRDGHDSAVSAVQGFQWYCQEAILSQKHRYLVDKSGYLRAPTSVTTDTCYGLCSLKGDCMAHGMCACFDGFGGSDCSVSLSQPPVISGIKGGRFCALSSLHCGTPTLIVKNVAPSDDLQVVVNASTFHPGPKVYTTFNLDAVYDNTFSVTVPMSHTLFTLKDHTVMQFHIKLTMDGKLFSKEYTYIVYDDKCFVCGITDGCLQKEHTCHIDRECFVVNEVNPRNSSEICDPEKALINWTGI